MYLPKILGLNLENVKKLKQLFMVFLKWEKNLSVNQINYGLIKEEEFIIIPCKND